MVLGALFLGLISSLHCIGMCGPIALMLPINQNSTSKKYLQLFLYQLGRVLAYTSLGIVFGIFGKSLFLAGAQQNLSIILGILMIVFALVPEKKLASFNLSKPIYKAIQKLKTALGKQFHKKSNTAIFSIGLLNGYLPCALVYIALFGALSAQNLQGSIKYMFWYGIGTLPLMTIIVLFSNKIKQKTQGKFSKLIPIFIVALGTLFIIRGLGLSIPFLSPSILNLIIGANVHCY